MQVLEQDLCRHNLAICPLNYIHSIYGCVQKPFENATSAMKVSVDCAQHCSRATHSDLYGVELYGFRCITPNCLVMGFTYCCIRCQYQQTAGTCIASTNLPTAPDTGWYWHSRPFKAIQGHFRNCFTQYIYHSNLVPIQCTGHVYNSTTYNLP